MTLRPGADRVGDLSATVTLDPYRATDMDEVLEAWLPLVFAVNSLNRSMGLADLYPFIISEEVRAKLRFMHSLTHAR